MDRTAAEWPAVTQKNPLLANVGNLYKHEIGYNDNTDALSFSLTGPKTYSGKNNAVLSGVIPDSTQIDNIVFQATGYRFPQSVNATSATAFPVTPTTEQVPITNVARFYQFNWSGSVLNQFWRMGQWYESLQDGPTQ